MVAQRKQIIITSDTYPKELANIDSRLISRFDSGLTVAIEPPELEMRVAILLHKADSEGVTMPEEVAFFIAKHLRSNVRELEGALRKVSRSEEHTSELQSLMRISYAVFCLKKKNNRNNIRRLKADSTKHNQK